MATLNPIVENNKARINQFLNSLCEVGDFYDTLEVPPCPHCQANTNHTPPDGPVYGSLKEGYDDPHHVERTAQHSLFDLAAYRSPCTFLTFLGRLSVARVTHRLLVT